MSEEITALGSSLLNRVSEGRRQVRRDIRRQQNIELGLKIASGGVRAYNNYLNRKGDAALNTEEAQGQSALIRKAIQDAETIKNDDVAARDFPGGEVAWLAKNKFAPVITDNLSRTFPDFSLYANEDIEDYVNNKAMEEAQKFLPTWRNSVDSAYRIAESDIQDFNDYIRANDGVADNVGGLLFNKAFNAITGKTDADVNAEITDAIRNNRFVNNANQLSAFNGALKAGINVQAAKNFARGPATGLYPDGIPLELKDLGIRRREQLPFRPTAIEENIIETVYVGGKPRQVRMNKVSGSMGESDLIVTRLEPVVTQTRDGLGRNALSADDAEAYRQFYIENDGVYNGIEMSLDSSMFSSLSQDGLTPEQIEQNKSFVYELEEQGKIALGPPENVYTETTNVYKDQVRVSTIPIYDRFTPGLMDDKRIVGRLINREPIQTATTMGEMEAAIPESVKDSNAALLSEEVNNLFMFDGVSIGERNLFEKAQAGTDFPDWEDGELDLTEARRRAGAQIAIQANNLQNNLELSASDAQDVSVLSYASSLAQGYNPDIDLVDRDGSPDFTKQPATAAFFGLNLLTHPKTTSEIKSRILNNESVYSALSTGMYNEISELVESQNTNNQEKGNFFLKRILSEPEVLSSLENIPVNLNEEPQLREPLIAAYGDVYQNAQSASMSELFRSLAPELVSGSPAPDSSISSIPAPDSGGINPSILDDYERPPELSSRVQRQLEDAARFQTPQEERTIGATSEQISNVQERQNNAARDIKETLSQKKLPSKDAGLGRAKINLALNSDLLTDEERQVLNTWLGTDSPK